MRIGANAVTAMFLLCGIVVAPVQGRAQDETLMAAEKEAVEVENENAAAVVVIETTMGVIKVELWAEKAPVTVENFLKYVDDKFFDGLVFHRVIDGFMVQGGGFVPGMAPKAGRAPIKNEARADAPNKRGTVAMARTSAIDSASSQFFVNLVDNQFLNHRDETQNGFGYCAFGRVIDGMDVVDKIGKVKTGRSGHFSDVPVEDVIMKRVYRDGK